MIAVQPELELAWQEFESASTYAFAQREVSTKKEKNNTPAKDDPLRQLREQFQAAIKDLRNDVSEHPALEKKLYFLSLCSFRFDF